MSSTWKVAHQFTSSTSKSFDSGTNASLKADGVNKSVTIK